MEKSVIEIMDILSNKIDEYISLNFFNEDKIAANVKFFKKKIQRGNQLIKNGDCILVYGKSKIFKIMIENAVKENKDFRLIYVDNRENNHSK